MRQRTVFSFVNLIFNYFQKFKHTWKFQPFIICFMYKVCVQCRQAEFSPAIAIHVTFSYCLKVHMLQRTFSCWTLRYKTKLCHHKLLTLYFVDVKVLYFGNFITITIFSCWNIYVSQVYFFNYTFLSIWMKTEMVFCTFRISFKLSCPFGIYIIKPCTYTS